MIKQADGFKVLGDTLIIPAHNNNSPYGTFVLTSLTAVILKYSY
jgi:hypothetical protein